MSVNCWSQVTKATARATASLTDSVVQRIFGNGRVASKTCNGAAILNNDAVSCVSLQTSHSTASVPCKRRRWQNIHHVVTPLSFESQRRSFFSLVRGEKEGLSKDKQAPTKITTKLENFGTVANNTNISNNRDWEDDYRKPITRELWNEFQNEGSRTRKYLSTPSLSQNPQLSSSSGTIPSYLYKAVLSELHAAIHETWNGPNAFEPPPEYGPTGKWTYRFETDANSNSRIYQRYLVADDALSETVLELLPTMEALAMSLSPDESLIACLLQSDDDFSSPQMTLRCVETKQESNFVGTEWLGDITNDPSEIVGLEWGPIVAREPMENEENADFVYSLYLLLADHQGRPNRVALCYVDSSTLKPTMPTVIYSSDDPAVMVDVQRTKGCSFVCIRALSKTSSEVFLSQGDDEEIILVRARQDGILYHVDVGKEGDVVLLTSDEGHPNGGDYFLQETTVEALPLPTDTPPPLPIKEEEEDYFVEDMDLFRSHIVLYERSRRNGSQRVRLRQRGVGSEHSTERDTILDLSSFSSGNTKDRDSEEWNLPLVWSKLSPVGNMCFESNFFRFELESPMTPGLVYEFDFDAQNVTMVSTRLNDNDCEERNCPDSIESDQAFRKETILVESFDGTKVPLTLFSKTNEGDETRMINSTKTVVLVGYGAYGEPMGLGYNPGWKHLLDRGVIVAFAHTRGGGDLGRAWYAKGRNENKMKGIEDYEACAMYLRERFDKTDDKFQSNETQTNFSLVAKAFSAGGVLVGAAVNRNPGLFDKVILTNAFVDVASTMSRPNLFLTEHEYDEFGNPQVDSIAKERIRSYCPVYNLQPRIQFEQTSTRFLLIGTLDDPNVPYWNASLYFRKLSEAFHNKSHKNDSDRVLLELQTSGGHHFSGPNRIDVLALENSFILKV